MLRNKNIRKDCSNIIMINSIYSIRGSYDRIQHVIIMDLDLVQFYLNIGYVVMFWNKDKLVQVSWNVPHGN